MMKDKRTKRNTETAIKEIYEKWGDHIVVPDEYEFKNVDYVSTFFCKYHGTFDRTFYQLMNRSYPCPKCSPTGPKGWKHIKQSLIEKHGHLYDYSLNDDNYQHKDKLKIICKKHGIFMQSVGDHRSGCGCPECYKEEKQTTINDFLLQSITKHGNAYDYRNVFNDYESISSKVTIICKKHGDFVQRAADHRNGVGCPWCKSNSKGEKIIKNMLERIGIDYISQKSFDGFLSPNKFPYRYDFYLPKYNILIEYDGIQHKTGEFMGKDNTKNIFLSDSEKNRYAKENNIKLIRLTDISDIDNLESIILFQ